MKTAFFPGVSLILLLQAGVQGQTDSLLLYPDQALTNMLEDNTADDKNTGLIEYLESLSANPIDINKADPEELLEIPFLNTEQAVLILQFRDSISGFTHPAQLYSIGLLDSASAARILPFIKVVPLLPEKTAHIQKPSEQSDEGNIDATQKNAELQKNADPKKKAESKKKTELQNRGGAQKRTEEHIKAAPLWSISLRSRMTYDLAESRGFSEDKYPGSRYKLYNRMRLGYGSRYQLGLLTEKDEGEKNIADFTSLYFLIKNIGVFDQIIAGDFLYEFGEGLISWSPYGFTAGSDAVQTVQRHSRSVIPYSGSGESRFFRGAGFNGHYKSFGLSAFISANSYDASVDSLTDIVTSIDIDGLHRTDSEIGKRNNLHSFSFGSEASVGIFDRIRLSMLYMRTNFDHGLTARGKTKKVFDNFSLAYQMTLSGYYFSGESSLYDGLLATVNSLRFNISPQLSGIFSVRRYPEGFIAHNSYCFGAGSGRTQNEEGIFSGINLKHSIGKFGLYIDIHRFPSATSDNPYPSKGNALYLDYEKRFPGKINFNLRYRSSQKEVLSGNRIEEKAARSVKADVLYEPAKNLRLQQRADLVFFDLGKTHQNGYAFHQSVKYDIKTKAVLYARVVFFQTDSYDTRIYAYEYDLPGVVSNSALYGKGIRWFVMVNYKVLGDLVLSAKYSETYKPDEKSLGTGWDKITGNLDNRISIQIEYNSGL